MSSSFNLEALLARMTMEEKVGQLTMLADAVRPYAANINPDNFSWKPDQLIGLIRGGQVGALFNGVGATKGHEIQRVAVEESRLGIPLLFAADAIHGFRTVFPIPLGEAASFEPGLAERTARATAIEATHEGIHWTFAPMADVARDQRWGRVAEGAGEDTFLGAAFAAARVRGFQGSDLRAEDSLLATPKHFAAYGAVAAGLDYNYADLAPQTLREVHLPPFKAALDAGALSIMTAFNSVNGVPATANRELLTGILRDEWGFKGLVVSDYTSDFELIAHGFAADEREATQLSLLAGLDMSMQSGLPMRHLVSLVQAGSVPLAQVDAAVRRILYVKDRLGLFQNPYRSLHPEADGTRPYTAAHDALARETARRSVVLLQNKGDLLPLRKGAQRLALIGPFGSDSENLAGCWDLFGNAERGVTLEAGLRAALEAQPALTVVPGSGMDSALEGGLEAAVAAACAADVVLLAIGEPASYSGEARSRTQIVLPAAQLALAERVIACGKPTIVLLRNGRALALPEVLLQARALLVTWFLGTQTGHAVADILFGDFNPSARLPVSFPRDSGQQPFFYNHPRSGRPCLPDGPQAFTARWMENPDTALFPFGHGLGYSPFKYSVPELSHTHLPWDATLAIRLEVQNTGRVVGEEVVQLYVHDRVASRVRPVRELKGFQKLRLHPDERTTVTFSLSRADLGFQSPAGQPVVEPGVFDLWVAPSAVAGEPLSFELIGPRPAGLLNAD